tara:strand:- start:2385 stop:2651 length:267 start_codon:yes stop_codon:yes gene_type:complete
MQTEKEILKEQIKHLEHIIEVLEDCKRRELDLKDIYKERSWLKNRFDDLEKSNQEGEYFTNCFGIKMRKPRNEKETKIKRTWKTETKR